MSGFIADRLTDADHSLLGLNRAQIPALRAWGINEADLPGIVEKAAKASSMQANPLPLTSEELTAVLLAAR